MSSGDEAIKDLKAAILAIEWEINDDAILSLMNAIEPLKKELAGKKPLLVCLQVMGTLGQYIKKAKQRAHPDAIQLLPSVFAALEKAVTGDALDEKEIVALVRVEVDKYNHLKNELAKPRKSAAKPSAPPQDVTAGAGGGGSTIRNLMDQKEDRAVDGAFNALFDEMVSGDNSQPPSKAAPSAMPSSTPVKGEGDKEVVPDRHDEEVFQEADDLLDDFFSDDGLDLSLGDEEPGQQEEAGGTVEVDVGQIKDEKVEETVVDVASVEEAGEEVDVSKIERIVKAINEDVSDSLLAELAEEIKALQGKYPDHSSMLLFLQSIASVGRHLQSNKECELELSCEILQKMYDRLSHALFTMKPQQHLLAAHLDMMQDYINWHEKIVSAMQKTVVEAPSVYDEMALKKTEKLPEEIRSEVVEIVRQEVDSLRTELLELITQN
ncbi:MAG: hypothetical protein KQH63_02615 [Desulfobulbaceae bacterium]|nr:hypothetical protein [Desulfobulbaceae bacterium]